MIKRAIQLAVKNGFIYPDPASLGEIITDKNFWLAIAKARKWDDEPTDVLVCKNDECTVSKAGHHFGTPEQFRKSKRKEMDALEIKYTEEEFRAIPATCGNCHKELVVEPRHITQNWLIQAIRTCEIMIKQGPKKAEKYINLIISTPLD